MKRATALMMCMFALGGAAVAQTNSQADPMSLYYDNTLVCSTASMQCHIWLKKDGTYRQFVATTAADGSLSLSGIEGSFKTTQKEGVAETCLMPRGIGGPMGGRATECYTLTGRKVGDEWRVTTNGKSVLLSLRAGRQTNAAIGYLN